jgi:hypothetical protein
MPGLYGILERHPPFEEVDIDRPVKDQMIQVGNPHDLARLTGPSCRVHIRIRRIQWPGGMAVRQDGGWGSIHERIGEDFSRMDGAAIDEPDGNDADIDHFGFPNSAALCFN